MNRAERKQLYRMLRDYGFSALKSLEITIDANRGDEYALALCLVVSKVQP